MKNLPRCLIAQLTLSIPLIASSATWNVVSGGNWNNVPNWNPASFPNGSDEIATLGNVITVDRSISLGETITVGELKIDSKFAYTLNNNQLIFDATGNGKISVTNANGNGAHVISSPIQLNKTVEVSQGSTGLLKINGIISGNPGIIKSGSGVLELGGNNAYLGDTFIKEGEIKYASQNSIPGFVTNTLSLVTVGDGSGLAESAKLRISTGMPFNNPLKVKIDTDGIIIQDNQKIVRLASLSGQGFAQLAAVGQLFEVMGSGGDSEYSGVIRGGVVGNDNNTEGGSRLHKSGNSTLTLSGTNTYVSRTFVSSGSVIKVKSAGALGASGSGSAAFARAGGAYELDGGFTLNKIFKINGTGISSGGAIRNISGANVISDTILVGWTGGNESAAVDASIGVDIGTLTISKDITGSNGLTKVGPGQLIYSGTVSNTLSGTTTVMDGTLSLQKTGGASAIVGPLVINGGVVDRIVGAQISTTIPVTLGGGEWKLSGFDQTVERLAFNSGTLTQGVNVLSLGATNGTALSMRNTTIAGAVKLIGAGNADIVFDSTNNGTAWINDIDMGAVSRNITVNNGTSLVDMTIGGSTGIGFTKLGAGRLDLTGVHNHAGFSTALSAGVISLGGSLSTSGLTVANGATLMGGGNLTGNVINNGTMAAGNSIGTFTVPTGNFDFNATSTYAVEIDTANSNSDLLLVQTGNVNIASGAVLSVLPLVNSYGNTTQTYTVIATPGGSINGVFNLSLPSDLVANLVEIKAVYSQKLLQLTLTKILLSNNLGGISIKHVENLITHLDGCTPPSTTDLGRIISLLNSASPENRIDALEKINPITFNNLALAQEKNTVEMRLAILNHLRAENVKVCREDGKLPLKTLELWSSIGGNQYKQKSHGPYIGLDSKSVKALMGLDYLASSEFRLGGVAAYSHSDVEYSKARGSAKVQTGYGSLFADGTFNHGFVDAMVMGGYSAYAQTRKLDFLGIKRNAKSHFHGGEFLAHLGFGGIIKGGFYDLRPFIASDYIYLHQNKYKESGAMSLGVYIPERSSKLVRGEAGVMFNSCASMKKGQILLDLKGSYIREQRLSSGRVEAELEESQCGTFVVEGLNPSQNIFAPAVGVTYRGSQGAYAMGIYYSGEYGRHYVNHSVDANFRLSF